MGDDGDGGCWISGWGISRGRTICEAEALRAAPRGAPSILYPQQGLSEVSPVLGLGRRCPGPFPWGWPVASGISVCSLFLLQVGCFLKTPRFPIWVVCSESHFSVLFSLQPELLRDWRTERLFDLYYYDGLANQQEQIRLTVGVLPPHPVPVP